ncbi:MAG: DNA polymerase Y family protein [Rhizobiaceae bacterium]|nr:DNA polymerase Y family protein [Rhizobiaceae bacterium]
MTSLFRNDSKRILAVWFPYLGTERIWRQRLGRSWRSKRPRAAPPLVVSRHENNTQRIAALDERAEALRLKRGLGLADARARHPDIDVVEADAEADRRLLVALADWCDRYTPLVAIEGEDGLFLDITGCAHLFGGEAAMVADLVRRLAEQGFDVRPGLASTPGMAWAAARFSLPAVECGEEEEALAPLPLSALRLEPAMRSGLESVGLRVVGSIIHAPRAPLARRFGKVLILRLDQALGVVEEAISPRLPVAFLSAERHFAEPLLRLEDIEQTVLMLAATLKADLERRGEGVRRLQLALFRVDGAVNRIAVGTSRPMREPGPIGRLFHERLTALGERIDAGYGFDLVRLGVLAATPFEDDQADLVASAPDGEEDMAFFTDRVRARLGEGALLRPVMVESHVPEQAVRNVPAALEPKQVVAAGGGALPAPDTEIRHAERPIRLFQRPEPVEVTAEVPEGPPAHFRWRRAAYRVVRAEGPERIAPEWWLDDGETRTRDYFRVEDMEGRRFWLYRQGLYGEAEAPRWFMQGMFA